MRRLAAVATAAVLAAGCLSERTRTDPTGLAECQLPLDRVARGDVIIIIRDQRFLPDSTHIRAGRTVTWVNCEAAGSDPHTATATDQSWGSDLLTGGRHFSHTFDSSGSFPYLCLPHPHMRGVVRVD
jgi:plastocyanin